MCIVFNWRGALLLPAGNRILDAVGPHDAAGVFARARVVALERSQVTTEQDRVMHTVDFPVTALLSIVGTLEDGATCELASVGAEAFVEVDAALRSNVAKRTANCQLEGTAVRVPIEDFQRGLSENAEFGRRVYRAVRARIFTTEQLAMCNVRHSVLQRLARWVLLSNERVRRAEFPVTHDFLAGMLGTRRASVSEAVAALVERGALASGRSSVAVAGRAALEASACECFALCRDAIAESTV